MRSWHHWNEGWMREQLGRAFPTREDMDSALYDVIEEMCSQLTILHEKINELQKEPTTCGGCDRERKVTKCCE